MNLFGAFEVLTSHQDMPPRRSSGAARRSAQKTKSSKFASPDSNMYSALSVDSENEEEQKGEHSEMESKDAGSDQEPTQYTGEVPTVPDTEAKVVSSFGYSPATKALTQHAVPITAPPKKSKREHIPVKILNIPPEGKKKIPVLRERPRKTALKAESPVRFGSTDASEEENMSSRNSAMSSQNNSDREESSHSENDQDKKNDEILALMKENKRLREREKMSKERADPAPNRTAHIKREILEGKLNESQAIKALLRALGETSSRVSGRAHSQSSLAPHAHHSHTDDNWDATSPFISQSPVILQSYAESHSAQQHELAVKKEMKKNIASLEAFQKFIYGKKWLSKACPFQEAANTLLHMVYAMVMSAPSSWTLPLKFLEEFFKKIHEKKMPFATVVGPSPEDGDYQTALHEHPIFRKLQQEQFTSQFNASQTTKAKDKSSKEKKEQRSSKPLGSKTKTASNTVFCEHHKGWFTVEDKHSSDNCIYHEKGWKITPHSSSSSSH